MNLLVSITSAAERSETRDETIHNLEAAGLTPAISLSTPDHRNVSLIKAEQERYESEGRLVWTSGDPKWGYGGHNNIAAARLPILYARNEGLDLLYCEDDIDLAPDFPWFLELAMGARDALTYMYTHDFRQEKQLGARYGWRTWRALKKAAFMHDPFRPAGLYRIRLTDQVNSGQCWFAPHPVLDTLPLHELSRTRSAIDTWIQHRATKFNIPVLTALPHPVQHRNDRTGREPPRFPKRGKHSMSFDLR